MATSLQTAHRLLTALDDLAQQEHLHLQAEEWVEAVELTERAAPIVTELCRLADEPAVAALRPRVASVIARRQASMDGLDSHIVRAQAELQRLGEARRRLACVAPAYHAGLERVSESRLNTAA